MEKIPREKNCRVSNNESTIKQPMEILLPNTAWKNSYYQLQTSDLDRQVAIQQRFQM